MVLSKTIETTGIINHQHHLVLDESLPVADACRVRVIVILPEESEKRCDSKTVLMDNSTRLNPLPGIFYSSIETKQYESFNREELYDR